jgi:hypothetical protein
MADDVGGCDVTTARAAVRWGILRAVAVTFAGPKPAQVGARCASLAPELYWSIVHLSRCQQGQGQGQGHSRREAVFLSMCWRGVLTEIFLCGACSCHEI